jgi:phage-related protein
VEVVFVLHCFQKKSKHANETPEEDMDIIRNRLKAAVAKIEELRHGKTHNGRH